MFTATETAAAAAETAAAVVAVLECFDRLEEEEDEGCPAPGAVDEDEEVACVCGLTVESPPVE